MPPGIFIVGLVILFFMIFKKQKRASILAISIAFLMFLFSMGFIGDVLLNSLEYKYTPPTNLNCDVVVVLGGGGVEDAPNIGFEGWVGPQATGRLLGALAVYQKIHCPIILSGGKLYGGNKSEAEIGKNVLMDLGVPEKMIYLEDRSINTTQNALFSSILIAAKGFKKPGLITSAFHMRRSMVEFEMNKFEMLPIPVGYITAPVVKGNLLTFMPTSDGLDRTSTALKEYLGLFRLWLM